VLDLEAGVHLQEVEGAVGAEEELDGADAVVADGLGGGHRRRPHPGPQVVVDGRGRRLLDELLVAALHGAVPFEEVHDRAVVVAEHLDLDVAAGRDVALEEHGRVAEGGGRLPGGVGDGGGQLGGGGRQAHPLAPATGRRLDQQREPEPLAGGEDGGLLGGRADGGIGG